MNASENRSANRHTARCTSPVFVVWQCRLVSVWLRAKETEISAASWALRLEKNYTLLMKKEDRSNASIFTLSHLW